MKNLGIIRRLDELGRVVIPIEIRKILGLIERDKIEFWLEGKNIILRKHETCCIFCLSTKDLKEYEKSCICDKCLEKLKKL